MELKLSPMLHGQATTVEASADFDFTQRDFDGFTLPAPVHFHYCASGKNGEVWLQSALRGSLTAQCVRCCEPFVRDFSLEKEYRITRADLDEEFPELPYTPDGNLDLEEYAYGELLLELSPFQLCSEGCEGLCQHCGLPKQACNCQKEPEGDPRLQVLRQLLDDD